MRDTLTTLPRYVKLSLCRKRDYDAKTSWGIMDRKDLGVQNRAKWEQHLKELKTTYHVEIHFESDNLKDVEAY